MLQECGDLRIRGNSDPGAVWAELQGKNKPAVRGLRAPGHGAGRLGLQMEQWPPSRSSSAFPPSCVLLLPAEEATVWNCAVLFWIPSEASQLLGVWKETEPEGLT